MLPARLTGSVLLYNSGTNDQYASEEFTSFDSVTVELCVCY